MRVLVLHNAYRELGGEDRVVDAEVTLMRQAGIEVRLETVHNRELTRLPQQVRAFWMAAHDPHRQRWMEDICATWQPDLVHVHNFFPQLTPAIHVAAAGQGLPVVQTLHNYRLLCANGLFLRHGKICENCISGNNVVAVMSRCYRGSLPATLTSMRMRAGAERHGVWSRCVHRFIALTEFARAKFVAGGFDPEQIAVKPNFADDVGQGQQRRSGALYVGRLAPEKGVETLIEAFRLLPELSLTVVGDGPLRDELMAKATPNVRFTGALDGDVVTRMMRGAAVLVMPSLFYEAFPRTIAEAFSAGLPVIASHLGALSELVGGSGAGRLFDAGDARSLAEVTRVLMADSYALDRLSETAREVYLRQYTPTHNLEMLLAIYDDAAKRARDLRI